MTDVEGSTRMWEERPDVAGPAVARHEELISAVTGDSGGMVLKSKGEVDSTFSVFADARDAARAAVESQRALQREPWPVFFNDPATTEIYTGEAELRADDY